MKKQNITDRNPETRNSTSASRNAPLAPLEWFFAGGELPQCEIVAAEDVPAPYCMLLVNQKDMTSTLMNYYQDGILIELIRKSAEFQQLRREVVLITERGGRIVEYGCIIIHLRHFAGEPLEKVLGCKLPLGGILNQYGIEYHSQPGAYFRIVPGGPIRAALKSEYSGWLYGRCNSLTNAAGESLADVVEILPHEGG